MWHNGIKPQSVINGFTATGIYPPDRNQYPLNRLDSEKLERYRERGTRLVDNGPDIHNIGGDRFAGIGPPDVGMPIAPEVQAPDVETPQEKPVTLPHDDGDDNISTPTCAPFTNLNSQPSCAYSSETSFESLLLKKNRQICSFHGKKTES